MVEIWKDIENYEGKYQVSNLGHVRRVYSPCTKHKDTRYRVLKPVPTCGYYRVSLHKNKVGKLFFVHRLVAKAFIPNPQNKPQVNHMNGNKADNSVENLEWATSLENNRHAFETGLNRYHPEYLPLLRGEDNPKHILTENDVREIRQLLKEGNMTQVEIGAKYGVSNFAICDIKRGRSWKEVV